MLSSVERSDGFSHLTHPDKSSHHPQPSLLHPGSSDPLPRSSHLLSEFVPLATRKFFYFFPGQIRLILLFFLFLKCGTLLGRLASCSLGQVPTVSPRGGQGSPWPRVRHIPAEVTQVLGVW